MPKKQSSRVGQDGIHWGANLDMKGRNQLQRALREVWGEIERRGVMWRAHDDHPAGRRT